MSQELFKWKLLPPEEVGGKKVAEISLNAGTASIDDTTKAAMAEVQREILAQNPDEEISLLIDLDGIGLGGLSDALHLEYIFELSELTKSLEQLIVFGGNRLLLGTAATFAYLGGANNVHIRRSRAAALEAVSGNTSAKK